MVPTRSRALVAFLEEIEAGFLSGRHRGLIDNPHLVPCWRLQDCVQTRCPVHGKEGIRCWLTAHTRCPERRPGQGTPNCRDCRVYRTATPTAESRLVEQLNRLLSLAHAGLQDGAGSLQAVSAGGMAARFDHAELTARERQIVPLLLGRLPRQEIATTLGLSPETVKTHIRNIYAKLGVASRRALLDLLQAR